MLIVKVEVWPGGNFDQAFEISRVGIANVSSLADISNYEMTALMDRDKKEFVLRSEINSHERASGWAPLAKRAMTALYLRDRLSQEVPYDDPVAEHLRRAKHV
jgi:hypothetical protein